jgi:hypothetical protein
VRWAAPRDGAHGGAPDAPQSPRGWFER